MDFHILNLLAEIFSVLDLVAISWFLGASIVYSWYAERGPNAHKSLSRHMDKQREAWLRVLLTRELRIIDTSIITGLQNGTAFFASASLLAIGGCFALLGSTEEVSRLLNDLPIAIATQPAQWELKVIGLLLIFAYAFFKFGWSFRLWSYASILLGAIPMPSEQDEAKSERCLQAALGMNKEAASHFNRGLRAFFFSLGFIGWFIGPVVFILATTLIVFVLYRRQFHSGSVKAARLSLPDDTR
ncbi:MAG: DUF599 family protein [Pseudomonadota bacterium]